MSKKQQDQETSDPEDKYDIVASENDVDELITRLEEVETLMKLDMRCLEEILQESELQKEDEESATTMMEDKLLSKELKRLEREFCSVQIAKTTKVDTFLDERTAR